MNYEFTVASLKNKKKFRRGLQLILGWSRIISLSQFLKTFYQLWQSISRISPKTLNTNTNNNEQEETKYS